MPQHLLNPAEGFSPAIGFFVSGMEEVREQLAVAVGSMTNDQLGLRAVPGAHSIAALVLHIGEAEWWWMQCNVFGHKLTPADRQAPVLGRAQGSQRRGKQTLFGAVLPG